MGKSNVRNSFQRKMAIELESYIGIPMRQRGGTYTIIRAIFDAMAEALTRGEKVKIAGLGTFTLRTRPATTHATRHYYNQKRHKKQIHPDWVVETFPPKKYVHFTPDPTILEALNDH